jgi:hypothetical protein
MKKKKRYILLQLEKPIEFEKLKNIKVILTEVNHVVISCDLASLSQVVSEIQRLGKIMNVSGTLKGLRRV